MSYIGSNPANKPLTSSDIEDSIVSLPKLASGTDGNLITYDASGNPVAVATGSDGQVLTSTGAGSPPAFEALPVGGITEADQWRLTANLTGDANPISSNLERVDSSGFGYIGSGMSVSSGVYTFPSTGIYLILFTETNKNASASSRFSRLDLDVTTDNSSFTAVAYAMTSLSHITSSTYNNATGQYIFDVTNTSTHKVRFAVEHAISSTELIGTTDENYTVFTFIRLGDT